MRPGLDHVASMCDHLVGTHYGRNTYMGVVDGVYLGPGPTGPRLILIEYGHGLIAQGRAKVDSVRFAAVRSDFDRWARPWLFLQDWMQWAEPPLPPPRRSRVVTQLEVEE